VPTLFESRLQFTFPDSWIVIKADTHRFYKYLSGRGFKGVDFLAMTDTHLYLIEVKNYENRYKEDGILPIQMLLDDLEKYALGYIQKFEDSFHLIHLIDKYYKRQYWKNISWRFLSWFLPKRLQQQFNRVFWPRAEDLLSQNAFTSILWLEPGADIDKTEWEILRKALCSVFDQKGKEITLMNKSDHIAEIVVS